MKVKGLSGAEAMLRLLSDMGVECIFASPGSEWAPIWECLANPELQNKFNYLSSRHEEIAVSMASGYTKSTGKLSAVLVHTTVGSLHASMALRGALHENVPMVIFAGESISFGETDGPDLGAHWLSQLADIGGPARLVERCVKWSFAVNTLSVFPSTIQRASQIAMTVPRGPVLISLPLEFLFGAMTTDAPQSAAIPLAATADSAGLDRLADMLCQASCPLIVTEECGRSAGATKCLIQIAELLSIPVVESRTAAYSNFPRTHPLHLGFDAAEFVREADTVLLIGAVAPWHPASAGPRPDATVAILDENPLRGDLPYWGYRVDLCLPGSIETSLARLYHRLEDRLAARKDSTRSSGRVKNWIERHTRQKDLQRAEALACHAQVPMDPRWVLHEINNLLPTDAIVVEETITDRGFINQQLSCLTPGRFFAGAIGGLGTGLGTALGVKFAHPRRPVVLLIGDGSFNYNPVPAALGFAKEYGIPILIVILNNHGYLSQKQGLPRYFPHGWAVKTSKFIGTSITPVPDYPALARAFGAEGEVVERPDQVGPAFARALKIIDSGVATLIDMRLNPVN